MGFLLLGVLTGIIAGLAISPEAFTVAPAWRDGGRGNVAAMTAIVMIFEMTLHNRGPQLRRADPAVAGKHLHPAL